jgi:hypothetical protein
MMRNRDKEKMIIKSSDQLPSITVLKRFPVPRNFVIAQPHVPDGVMRFDEKGF